MISYNPIIILPPHSYIAPSPFPLTTGNHGFARWLSGKEPTCQCIRCKRREFDTWVRRSPGEGNGNPLQYSCLENSMDRSLVGYRPWGCKESDMTYRARTHTHTQVIAGLYSVSVSQS